MFARWFTPQESVVVLVVAGCLLVGSIVLVAGRAVSVIQDDIYIIDAPDEMTVTDETEIYAPHKAKELELASVNINTADREELQMLPGIGVVRAEAILEYRELHGEFTDTKDLMLVKGIGVGTYNEIEKYLNIELQKEAP